MFNLKSNNASVPKIELINKIIESEKDAVIKINRRFVTITVFDASIIFRTLNTMNAEEKAKFIGRDWQEIRDISWKHILKQFKLYSN